MNSGKRIGFVDNDLNNYHADVYLAAMRKELVARGYTVAGCIGLEREKGKAWAVKNGVTYFDDAKQLNENVDCYCVLAPGTPKTHLQLCEQVVPFGKTTFVDKPFAHDLATSQKIFALADRYKVAMQTCSALRYTQVQPKAKEMGGPDAIRHMVAWGGGRSFDEYAIHPIELVVSCMGPKAERLMRRGSGNESQVLIDFSDGRTAVVNVYIGNNTDYFASLSTLKDTAFVSAESEHLFVDAAAGMLDFFDAGKALIDRNESLAIMAIIDAARTPQALAGFVPLT